jgi:hypothetical protein
MCVIIKTNNNNWSGLHVVVLAHKMHGIVISQNKTKHLYSIDGIITNLQCYRLGIENLDRFILILQNWPNDVYVECVGSEPQNMQDFLSSYEAILLEEHKKLIVENELFENDYDDI